MGEAGDALARSVGAAAASTRRGALESPHEPRVEGDAFRLRRGLERRLQRLGQAERDAGREPVLSRGRRLGLLFLDVDELRVLPREPDVDVAVRKLRGKVERDLCERVDQPQRGGLLDGALEAVGRLDELLAADLRQLAQVGLEGFDEI